MTNPKRHILIVEDDPFIALDLLDTFEAAGFEVTGPKANVDDALSALRDATPDVALLDYNLGQETSLPIAQKLKAMGVPFLFLSGQTSRIILDQDGDDITVLTKPFEPKRLLDSVTQKIPNIAAND